MRSELTASGAVDRIEGPLLFLKRTVEVGLNEAVTVVGEDARERLGRVVTIDEQSLVIEVLQDTQGLSLSETHVRFHGEPMTFGVGPGILGRTFDGVGRVTDRGPPVPADQALPIGGWAINPASRANPADFIETGIGAIDVLNSLVRGQKLPLFSGGGLPHNDVALQIAQHARLLGEQAEQFALVFVGIGVPHDTAEAFRSTLEESGALTHTALFMTLADDSSTQRLLTPRFALTAAEYLAFYEGRHVLVILTDMTNYCEALREVSASHGEIPSRKGYPGYLYSDLATLYERAGIIQDRPGSLTQLPVLTMPSDDITHPVPDLTGYITEGQIVLDRELDRAGVYPPIKVLPSLSRLMKDGTGEGYTHADHPALASQLYAAYARAVRTRTLANVVGEEGLTEADRRFLRFGERFEQEWLSQAEPRSLQKSLNVGWQVLGTLPTSELTRLSDEQIKQYITQSNGP